MAGRDYRTREDLERAVRAIAGMFKTDTVVIIGSQAVLVGWPVPPTTMLRSAEIDAYPLNAPLWEHENDGEAAEYINAVLGWGSDFHTHHGFYVDGVDKQTARLPLGWERRAVFLDVPAAEPGKKLLAIAPCTEDLVVAKVIRCEQKDKDYIRSCHNVRPLDIQVLEQRLRTVPGITQPEIDQAANYLRSLPKPSVIVVPPKPRVEVPKHDQETHNAFISRDGKSCVVREKDPESGLFVKVGNLHGPALVTTERTEYWINGLQLSQAEWEAHPAVTAARTRHAPSQP